jgi:hypothetical protein
MTTKQQDVKFNKRFANRRWMELVKSGRYKLSAEQQALMPLMIDSTFSDGAAGMWRCNPSIDNLIAWTGFTNYAIKRGLESLQQLELLDWREPKRGKSGTFYPRNYIHLWLHLGETSNEITVDLGETTHEIAEADMPSPEVTSAKPLTVSPVTNIVKITESEAVVETTEDSQSSLTILDDMIKNLDDVEKMLQESEIEDTSSNADDKDSMCSAAEEQSSYYAFEYSGHPCGSGKICSNLNDKVREFQQALWYKGAYGLLSNELWSYPSLNGVDGGQYEFISWVRDDKYPPTEERLDKISKRLQDAGYFCNVVSYMDDEAIIFEFDNEPVECNRYADFLLAVGAEDGVQDTSEEPIPF